MGAYDALSGFVVVPQNVTNSYDDVIDNFLDVISINAVNDDLFSIAVVAFTDIKPYIAFSIELFDASGSIIALDEADICDTNTVRHISRFGQFGARYAGQTLRVELLVNWLDPDGSKKTTKYTKNMIVEKDPAVATFEVTAPRAKNGTQTKVRYGTYGSTSDYDYIYSDNKVSSSNVKAMLPLKGYMEFGPEWHPMEIDYSENNNPKLYMLLSSGGVVSYGKDFKPVFALGTNRVDFSLPNDDWGTTIETSRLGSQTTLDLYFSFTLRLKNDYFPKEKYTARGIVVCRPLASEEDKLVEVTLIEPIYIYWDCLAGDMTVNMYPEGTKAVSELTTGDQVIDGEGNARVVAQCVSGHASEIVRITTKAGIVFEATASHEVRTHTGYVPVGNLTNCNYLLIKRDSSATEVVEEIACCETLPYSGTVYYVELEDGESLLCNGVVTADSKHSKARKNRKWPDEVLKVRALLHEAFSQKREHGSTSRFK